MAEHAIPGGRRVDGDCANVFVLDDETLRASREDPLAPTAAANVGEALCVIGRTDEGLAQLARLAAMPRRLRRVASFTGLCYAMKGMWKEALPQFRIDYSGYDPWAPMYGYVLARSGAVADAKQLQREYVATWQKTGRGATKIEHRTRLT